MTLQEDLTKAKAEYDNTIAKARLEYDKKFREVSDKAELKYRKKVSDLNVYAIQNKSLELKKK